MSATGPIVVIIAITASIIIIIVAIHHNHRIYGSLVYLGDAGVISL